MERMIRGESDLVDQLAQACRSAVEADGTEAVLLGYTCMSPIAESIQERCSFPVLDASKAGLQAGFDALLTGKSAPTRVASSNFGLASKLVDAWLNGSVPAEPFSDECEVCAIAQSDA